MTADNRAWAEIDLNAVAFNVASILNSLPAGAQMMAVVKADAYGHGFLTVSRVALQAGCSWLGVAAVGEGIQLREQGIGAPIAVLAPCAPEEAPEIAEYGLTCMAGDPEIVHALGAQVRPDRPISVHLDIDTGMGRSGILTSQATELFWLAVKCGLRVTGVSTHFSDADGDDPLHTECQMRLFSEARRDLASAGASFQWIHMSNSAATLRLPAYGCNLYRPGLIMYGIRCTLEGQQPANRPELHRVLSLYARAASIRELPAGHAIGYGASCILKAPARVATVTIGYGDGYPRSLSNCADMLIRGRRAPILGRVSMDQTVVDVTHIPDAVPGDIAVCIGSQGEQEITVNELAQQSGLIDHEITTGLSMRIPRRFVGYNP
jgi:alanine racemase